MLRCPRCGSQHEEDVLFCHECGRGLTSDDIADGKPVGPPMAVSLAGAGASTATLVAVRCRACGGPASVETRYCTNCGSGMSTARPEGGARRSSMEEADVAGVGRYVLSFLLAGLVGLGLQYLLRRQGWLATWINAGIFVVMVVIIVALVMNAEPVDCFRTAANELICR